MSANTATLTAVHRDRNKNAIVPTLVGVVAWMILRVRDYYARRANVALLLSMDDRSLKDIGLTRCDVDRIARM